MDKKGWPWKKKMSEKTVSVGDSTESSQASGEMQSDEQEAPKSVGDLQMSDESSALSQQGESKLKDISDQLSDATSDVTTKDDLVKQHMKIAEEAVTGWEKAEAEALALKEKLDDAIQQKLATEDRVLHLDGALKECMRQLRHVREEQEQKIHDAVVKKSREWEKNCTDLEAKLADVESQLCEALAENKIMSRSLQERSKSIMEINDIKSRIEAENNKLQVRLGVLEKENARFKYELHALGKELEIRNEEREYSKKATEAANRQNLESVKKIAKLEEECHRLRLLVKKRTPSPCTQPQKRSEIEFMGKEIGERNRRRSPCRRSATFLPGEAPPDLELENKMLSDRLAAMEEETKALKETLAKRDHDLQAARLMCARTANKLSFAEDQLESLSSSCCSTKSGIALERSSRTPPQILGDCLQPNVASAGAEEVVIAESWASALIAELAHFKKEKGMPASENARASVNFDLMDDFVEMEKLASLSSANELDESEKFEKSEDRDSLKKHLDCDERPKGNVRNAESSLDQLCRELKDKLADAEIQLNVLQAKQSESEATIHKLEHLLGRKIEAEGNGKLLTVALEDAKVAKNADKSAEAEHLLDSKFGPEVVSEKSNGWLPTFISENTVSEVDAVVPGGSELDICRVGPELAAAVRKVLDIVEGIAQTDYNLPYSQWMPDAGHNADAESGEDPSSANLEKQWRSSGVDACVESLVNLCNSLIQGKVDIVDFIAEVASALDWLVGLIFSVPDKSPARICSQRQSLSCKDSPLSSDSEVTSAGNSPSTILCNARDPDEAKATGPHDALPDQISVSDLSSQCSLMSVHDEELTKVMSEKATLTMKLEAEITRAESLEREVLRLKSENDKLEHNYKLTTEKIADLSSQIHEANKKIQIMNNELLESECHSSDLQLQLHMTLEKKQSVENSLAELQSAKWLLESQLHHSKETVKALENKVSALEDELEEEIGCRKQLEIQFQELKQEQEQLRGVGTNDIMLSAEEEAARLKKEQEITAAAEKLAECQQTILMLGKQLKALGAPKGAVDVSFTNPVESVSWPSPLPPVSQRFRSSSDQVHSESDVSDELLSSGTEDPRASPAALDWPRNERDRKQEHNNSRSSGNFQRGGFQEADSGTTIRRGQTSGRYGRHAQPELYKGSTFPSPTQADNQEGTSTMEPVVSSPLRSPVRFLSLRGRNANNTHELSKHGDSESSEKHGSGFSRFFVRTKSSH